MNRRTFLYTGGMALAATAGMGTLGCAGKAPLYKISLAEWSLHRTLFGGELDNLDFPRVARQDFGIDAVEYVNQFFMDKAKDSAYMKELKSRCDGEGVRSQLIMCDNEGALGDPDGARRTQAVENHYKWVEAAALLGCHSIRVNARSHGSYEEQQKLAADGLSRLTEFAVQHRLNVIVENHGGLSSNGQWLAGVMKLVDNPRCGTLPDFGNFRVSETEEYNRYQGVAELMPYAKAVSAKSMDFDDEGNETTIDYFKMMKIVVDSSYHDYIGIEYSGQRLSEPDGILATKKLLLRVQETLAG